MILDDNHIVLAAEYVLGTLDNAEVVEAERLLAQEPDFLKLVLEWERRLGELSAMVASIEPPPSMLERIHALLPGVAQASSVGLKDGEADRAADRVRLGAAPQLEMPRPATPLESDATAAPVPPPLPGEGAAANDNARVVLLSNSVRRWRAAGTVFGALAALFAAVIVTSVVRPDMLPPPLRPREKVVEKVVEKVAEKPSRFVAVLQRDAVSPAFILTVDLETRSMNVRRVAAETPTGKSYELWLVSSKYPAPRSLGVVGSSEFTAPTALANYPADTVNDATYAISLEPEGGSPTGQVTGPVLWTGKLVEAVPPDAKP